MIRRFVLISIVLLTTPAGAQSLPGLENFTLERPQPPTPSATPTAGPTPAPSASPSAPATGVPAPIETPVVAPSPTSTPAPAAGSTATPTSVARLPEPGPTMPPVAFPTTTATLAPDAVPTAPPDAEPVPAPVADPAGSKWWPWATGAALVLLLGAFGWRRRRTVREADLADDDTPVAVVVAPFQPQPAVTPTPRPALAPRPPGGLVTTALRPEITFDLRAVGAGIDSLRATLDYDLVVRNTGRGSARAVLIEAWLFAADRDPRAELDRMFVAPSGQPLIPPFDLPGSAVADIVGQSVAPRDTLATISAGGRTMFVPMLAVRALYRNGQGASQNHTAAFMLGIERPGQSRLTPLALDRGARRYDALVARRFDD